MNNPTAAHHADTQNACYTKKKTISGLSLFLLGALFFAPSTAHAIPSFAVQTNQPCSACHVGAYGPQLKPYGRDFKLGGYTASDRPNDNLKDNWEERFTAAFWGSFNRSDKAISPQPGGKAGAYGSNDNFSFDQAALYFGGRITPHIGAIQEFSYDGAEQTLFWDALDLRYSHDGEVFGKDSTYGLILGNQLGNTSPWNSTPPNAFPYSASRILPTPQGTLIDDTLNGQVFGPGAFVMWNDLLYADLSVYFPLSRNIDQAIGNTATDKYVTPLPFWHLALQKEFDHHEQYIQIGTFGTIADRQPDNDQTTGLVDHVSDFAAEANYQYMADMHNMWSAHATYIHENLDNKASYALGNTSNPKNNLDVFRTDLTYTIDDTWTPTVQYFKVTGSRDATLYGSSLGSVNGSPNSEGFTTELAYVPFGKPDSSFNWGNARLALQYTAYTQYNGTAKHASDNNALFLSLIMHFDPFVPLVGTKTK